MIYLSRTSVHKELIVQNLVKLLKLDSRGKNSTFMVNITFFIISERIRRLSAFNITTINPSPQHTYIKLCYLTNQVVYWKYERTLLETHIYNIILDYCFIFSTFGLTLSAQPS